MSSSIIKTAHEIDALERTDDILVTSNDSINFSNMMLSEHVIKGLSNAGFVKPSPIQLEAIPVGRCGLDLVVQAKSGTGKTCVFAVVALESVNVECSSVQVLILAPTREIVVQISEVINAIGSSVPKLKCCTFIGGMSLANDKQNIRRCHIAVGTPGRVKQLIKDKHFNPNAVRLFVLDEADKLLEENFQKDINWIYHHLPSNKQIMALSATYPEQLAEFLTRYMQNPTFVRLNSKDPALIGIKQFSRRTIYHPLATKCFENKVPHIIEILSHLEFGQCLVFSNYQLRAQNLSDKLSALGWPATCICGKMEQIQRQEVMKQMKQFERKVLISTDLTARGVDVQNVNLVINLDVPYDLETYLHRIGRAGRFGSHGIAITLAAEGEEENLLDKIKSAGGLKIGNLPDTVSSQLWSMEKPLSTNGATESVVIFRQPSSKVVDETQQQPPKKVQNHLSNNKELVLEHDAAVGAGLLETLTHEENLRKETLGQKKKLKTKRNRNTHTKSSSSVQDSSATVRQVNLGKGMTQKLDDKTHSENERDLIDFLNKECDVLTKPSETESGDGEKKPHCTSEDFYSTNTFLQNLHTTFFENLKKDLKPVLDLDRDKQLNGRLEEWMELLNLEEEICDQDFIVDPQTSNEVSQTENPADTKENTAKESVNETVQCKVIEKETLNLDLESSSCDNQSSNEVNLSNDSHSTQNISPHFEHISDKQTECDSQRPFDYYYEENNVANYSHVDWNARCRSVQISKYLLWYQEYTKYMLNHK